jgi:hypothetical protein
MVLASIVKRARLHRDGDVSYATVNECFTTAGCEWSAGNWPRRLSRKARAACGATFLEREILALLLGLIFKHAAFSWLRPRPSSDTLDMSFDALVSIEEAHRIAKMVSEGYCTGCASSPCFWSLHVMSKT